MRWKESRENPLFEMEAHCIKETDLAILVEDYEGFELWIPKSVVDLSSDVNGEGDDGSLVIQEWFAKQKGLV